MGDVAASGGYYIASGGRRVFAEEGTLTGSIGVVVAKPNLRGFLERIGIHAEQIQRGEHAGMQSVTRGLSDSDRLRVIAAMQKG